MKSKITDYAAIVKCFKDGQTIAIGGQANHGSPNKLIQCLLDSGAKHLTIISIDSGDVDVTIGRLVHAGVVDKMITSHIGKNSETVGLYEAGKIEIELNPMGTLTERMRCGGVGLGGVLTKTGIGTVVAERRQTIAIDGEDYLLEPALRPDISLTRGHFVDPIGNIAYHGTGCNSNPVWAMAGKLSIVEADFLVDLGEISDDNIVTPSPFVDIILGQEVRFK